MFTACVGACFADVLCLLFSTALCFGVCYENAMLRVPLCGEVHYCSMPSGGVANVLKCYCVVGIATQLSVALCLFSFSALLWGRQWRHHNSCAWTNNIVACCSLCNY